MMVPTASKRSPCAVVLTALLISLTACSAGDQSEPPASTSAVSSSGPSPSATAQPVPTPAPDACARSALARMNLNQRIGQLMMVGVPANDPVGGYTELVTYAVGGVFLAGRTSTGAEVVGTAVTTLQVQGLNATGTFLHVAADQEGGLVQTLSGPGFSPIPDGVEQGRL
ncbi:MAG: hypothetical protein H0T40_08295, partial [Geodermatophilaceae bacterium]|nr:hypothetical protein [Geodermatophilaceae bacterium]